VASHGGGFELASPPPGALSPPAALEIAQGREEASDEPARARVAAAPQPPVRPAEISAVVEDAADRFVPVPPRRPVELARVKPTPSPAEIAEAVRPRVEEAVRPRVETAQSLEPRRAPGRGRRAVALRNAPQEPGLFERIFGRSDAAIGPAMAYAPVGGPANDGAGLSAPSGASASPSRLGHAPRFSPKPTLGAGRAIYDISAQTLHLPDGTRLEAHSGLGQHRDDPSSRQLRMRGVTPPHVYELREREALFHGVRAIRLLPVGGSGAIYGRAGLLAHTYMLGPNGDSNGCVSIRDYNTFLQAYLSGQIRQLVVVDSMRNLPSQFAQR
jgi:hypothetical protein